MSTREDDAKYVKDNFDIDNPTEFYRWATPILLHVLKYGKGMRPSRFKINVHRAVFRQVLMQMTAWGFWKVLEGLSDEDTLVVNKWLATHDTDEFRGAAWMSLNFENILWKWYEELERGE
jgi:hypothetical protein